MGREAVDAWLERTKSASARERALAARKLCPCDLRRDYEDVWDRLLEMLDDDDEKVRSLVLHSLCDGSPKGYAERIAEALEARWMDPAPKLRRRIRHVLGEYRRAGNLNVL